MDKKIDEHAHPISSRRNTGQPGTDVAPLLGPVTDDELTGPALAVNHDSLNLSASEKRFDSRLDSTSDIPEGRDNARNSLVTLINALDQEVTMLGRDFKTPRSAASDVTLFDISANGPLAESTPHESIRIRARHSGQQQLAPPVPPLPQNAFSQRSSISYVKSDEKTAPAVTIITATKTVRSPSPRRIAELSSRVKPSVAKSKAMAGKLRIKVTPPVSENAITGSSNGGGLRPLSLLQDCSVNRDANPPGVDTRPLTVGKKHRKAVVENTDSGDVGKSSPAKKGLRPLRLVRSESIRQRAVLRELEALP